MEAPRAVIVGGDPLVRTGLAALLAGRSDVAVLAGLSPGDRQAFATLRADVALLDAQSTEPDELREIASALPVVALVTGEAQAAEALAAGSRAAVFRDAGADRIAAALVAAARGLVAVEGALSSWLRPPAPPAASDVEPLTPREAEVLALLAEGLANKSIAQRLGVSERTAKFHVESILGKLGAENRSEAIVIAARRGMVTL
jgi:two-component system, NarL family, nitrate/nitrite response regulator NarL